MRAAHIAAGAGTTAHQALELAAGTGVIGAGVLGFPGATAASIALNTVWLTAATRNRPPHRVLAALTGIAIGVPLLHFTIWPWERRRGVPVLTSAEGLPEAVLPAYNALLYAWCASGVVALATTPRRHRWIGIASTAGVLASRPIVARHFDWMRDAARTQPAWWNRAWLRQAE